MRLLRRPLPASATPVAIAADRPRDVIARGAAVAVGSFDGVHRGHRALVDRLRTAAQPRELATVVLTFEPHPREWFARRAGQPEAAPVRISGLRDKATRLFDAGVDAVAVARFDGRMASMAPEAFVDDILVRGLNARHLLVGDDFRFGARRAGDLALLERLAPSRGYVVERLDTVADVHGLRVSSSAVRARLAAGDLDMAATLLGAPVALSGHVVHGRKLGRTLGFPTLNVRVPPRPALAGIYAVTVTGLPESGAAPGAPASARALPGVASLGTRPAVEADGAMLLEVHLLDWAGDAYGRCVQVAFHDKLRDEARYDTLDAMVAQIHRDEADARRCLAARGLMPA